MNDLINEIGFIIWGCRMGYKPCLISNGIVDVNDEDIAETVKDIRKYVRFLRPRIDYYALEFTPKYKVFTIYRSSYDSGDGAYIAITIYVPHARKFQNVRSVLFDMMELYFRQYISALSGGHIEGKSYDINLFRDILRNHSDNLISETACYKTQRSERNNVPQLYVYDNLAKVDEYFGSPYREIFRRSQEVTMVSRESVSMDKYDDYRPVIDGSLHVIADNEIGNPEQIPSDDEVVKVSIECEQVTAINSKKLLFVRDSVGKKYPFVIDNGKLSFSFKGANIDKQFDIVLLPFQGSEHAVFVTNFIPRNSQIVRVDVTTVTISISKESVVCDSIGMITVKGDKVDGTNVFSETLNLNSASVLPSLYLPSSISSEVNYSFDITDYNVLEFDKQSMQVTVEPKYCRVDIQMWDLPQVLDDICKKNKLSKAALDISTKKLWFEIEGKKYETQFDSKTSKLFIKFPYHFKEENIEFGSLHQESGLDVDYGLTSDNVLCLKCSVVINPLDSQSKICLKCKGDGSTKSLSLGPKCFQFIPEDYEITETDSLEIHQIDKGNGHFACYELKPVSYISKVDIYLHGCEKLCFCDRKNGKYIEFSKLEPKFYNSDQKCYVIPLNDRSEYIIYDNNGKVLFRVQFTESKYLENKGISNENKKNGFKIEWKDDKCHIYYKPNQNKLLEQINNFIRKNVNKAMLLLLLFLICGFGVYKLLFAPKPVLPYRIVFVDVDNNPMEIDESSINGFSDSVAVSKDTLLLYKEIKGEKEIIRFKDKWYSVNLQEVHNAYSDSISNHFSDDKKQTEPLKINIEKFIPPFKIVFCKKSDKSIKKIEGVAGVCESVERNGDTLLLSYSCLNEMEKDSVVIYFEPSRSNDSRNNNRDSILLLFADLKKNENIKLYFYGKQKQDSFLLFEVAPMVDATTALKELRNSLTDIIANINNKTDYSRYEGRYNALLNDYEKEYREDNAEAIKGYKKFLDAYKAFLFCKKDNGWEKVVAFQNGGFKDYLSAKQKWWFANTYACNENIFKVLYDKVPGIDLKIAGKLRESDGQGENSGIQWPSVK